MRISTDWLADFVAGAPPPEELAQELTMRGLEVDSVERAGPELPGVVVGRIDRFERMPGTSLSLCSVATGAGKGGSQIVCGAPNLSAGMMVAVARPGSVVGGQKIGPRKIAGELSEGMICSEHELGLGDDADGVIRLDPAAKVGRALEEELALDAKVLEVAVTPNRGDCLSALGIAREVSAIRGKLKKLKLGFAPASKERRDMKILKSAAAACPLYGSVVVRGIAPGASSPRWMQERLRRCGLRPISAAVDVTNYVMLAIGQPLHAFDLDRLRGGIRVRFARKGEKLLLLDGQEAELDARTLVIADEKRAVALGGVMGGMESSVTAETTNVLLEGAHFSPEVVRGKTRAYNLSSEAAFRFERGVDFEAPRKALAMAAALLTSTCGGDAGPVSVARAGSLPKRKAVVADTRIFPGLLGIDRSAKDAVKALRKLGFDASERGGKVRATPPPHRFDVSLPEDLAEEVARERGYDRIPSTLPDAAGRMLPPGAEASRVFRIKRKLADCGYSEVVTYSFVPESWETGLHGNGSPLRLSNPISDEATVMRSSLIGGLVARARHNHRRRQERLQIFEVGKCFPSAEAVGGEQPTRVAGLCYGLFAPASWGGDGREFDFFDARGDAEALLPGGATFEPCDSHPALHPGKCARILAGGEVVGHVGALHPRHTKGRGLPSSIHLFELAVDSVIESHSAKVAVGRLSKLPMVHRDLSMVVKEEIPAGVVLDAARRMEEKASVRSIELFDNYPGAEGEGRGLKRLGFRMAMQGEDANLEEREIAALVGELESLLGSEFGAKKAASGS